MCLDVHDVAYANSTCVYIVHVFMYMKYLSCVRVCVSCMCEHSGLGVDMNLRYHEELGWYRMEDGRRVWGWSVKPSWRRTRRY